MKVLIALALLAPTSDAAGLRASRSRRLADQLDLSRLEEAAGEGRLGSKINFKLDGNHKMSRKGETSRLATKVARRLHCGKPTRVFRDAGKHEAAQKAAGLDLWYTVQCAHGGDKKNEATSRAAFEKLRRFLDSEDHDGVAFVEPEVEKKMTFTPNDSEYAKQGHYDTIKLEAAWDVTTGSPDVAVMVVDSGIDIEHPDLKNNVWRNEGEICGNGIDDDNNGYVDDCHGYNHADDTGTDLLGNHWHGSHCGGTIAADNNNGVGVAGVAGGDGSANSGAKLMISVGFGKTAVDGFAEALVYGADMGAQISSNSWGYTGAGPRLASVTTFERF